MLLQVVIGTVRNAPEFAPSKGKFVLEIRSGFAVMRKFLFFMISQPNIFHIHAKGFEPVCTEIPPVLKPFQIRSRFAEKFQFHLFELSCSESEIARRNFVSEGFSDLTDSKGNLFSR